MSHILSTLKKSVQARDSLRRPRLRIVHPSERGTSKRGARRYLLASVLVFGVCLLLWWLGPWRSGEDANQWSKPALDPQTLQGKRAARLDLSAPFPGKADEPARQRSEGEKHLLVDRNQQMGLKAPSAPANAGAAGQPPVDWDELPSAQRARSILLDSSGPVPGPTVAEEAGNSPAKPAKSRSAARSIALTDLSERLPAGYFDKESRSEAALAGKVGDPPKWPEPSKAGKPTNLSAQPARAEDGAKKPGVTLKTASDKAVASEQPLGFYEVPSKIRDSIPMSISMLVYSKQPDKRWANIDGSRVREGEQMPSGLRVEEITPDGVVFNYQGHSFYKAVRED